MKNSGSIFFLVFFFGFFILAVIIISKRRDRHRQVPGHDFPITDASVFTADDTPVDHSQHGHDGSFDGGHAGIDNTSESQNEY